MTRKFEELLDELRAVMRKIEDPETGLDESIELYEKGAALVRQCEDVLKKAELKITEINEHCD